jgi:hypothetical protein
MDAALEQVKLAQERVKALRRGQRALAAVGGFFVCTILGALGGYNQDFLKEQYQWHVVMRPSMLNMTRLRPSATSLKTSVPERAAGVLNRHGNRMAVLDGGTAAKHGGPVGDFCRTEVSP